MNFTFTKRSAAIFVLGMVAAATLNAVFNVHYLGLGIMIAVCYYLATEQKK